MARVALLVTALAALCYMTQAIPVLVENVEDAQSELPNIIGQEMFDQIRSKMRDGFEDWMKDIRKNIDEFVKELKAKKKLDESTFETNIERAKKLLQDKTQNANEIFGNLIKTKSQIEQDYQNALNDRMEKLKDGFEKLKDRINEKIRAKGQNGGESFGIIGNILEKDKGTTNDIKDKRKKLKELTENLKNNAAKDIDDILNGFKQKGEEKKQELRKKMEQGLEELKKKSNDMKDEIKEQMEKMKKQIKDAAEKRASEVKENIDKLKNKLKEIAENIENRIGNLIKQREEALKNTFSNKEKITATPFFIGKIVEGTIIEVLDGTKNIVKDTGTMVDNIIRNILKGIAEPLKPNGIKDKITKDMTKEGTDVIDRTLSSLAGGVGGIDRIFG